MIIDNHKQLEALREGGKINKQILQQALEMAVPDISTYEIEKFVVKEMNRHGVIPSFLGYDAGDGPYPFATCIGINHQLVHTLPSKRAIIKKGDVVTIDMGVLHKGFHTDTAFTVEVGGTNDYKHFLTTGKKALKNAIRQAKTGNYTGDLSYEMQKTVESAGYNVSVDLVGHGIGKKLHEPPQVLCYGKRGTGDLLVKGMVLAVEIMYMAGNSDLTLGEDNFSLDTLDGSVSGQFEHTLVVGEKGPEILV